MHFEASHDTKPKTKKRNVVSQSACCNSAPNPVQGWRDRTGRELRHLRSCKAWGPTQGRTSMRWAVNQALMLRELREMSSCTSSFKIASAMLSSSFCTCTHRTLSIIMHWRFTVLTSLYVRPTHIGPIILNATTKNTRNKTSGKAGLHMEPWHRVSNKHLGLGARTNCGRGRRCMHTCASSCNSAVATCLPSTQTQIMSRHPIDTRCKPQG